MDLNHGPLGYEPSELPSCSTPRRLLQAAVIYFIGRQGIVKSACRSAHSGLRGSCLAATVGYLHGCALGGYWLHGRVFSRWRRWLAYVAACLLSRTRVEASFYQGYCARIVCRGMRGRLDVGGLALLPVVSGGLCMSWHTLPAVSGEFRMVTVGLPHVAYVSVYVSRRLSDGWGCARWCSASCVCTGMRIAADAGGFGRERGGFAGWVCAGMRVRLDVGGLALLPVCIWRVAYVVAYTTRQMPAGLGFAVMFRRLCVS